MSPRSGCNHWYAWSPRHLHCPERLSCWDTKVLLEMSESHCTDLFCEKSSINKLCFFPLGLLSLSVKGAEVASMTMDVIQSIPNLDWLSVWVKAYAFIHAGDNQRAINTIWWAGQQRFEHSGSFQVDSLIYYWCASIPPLVSALLRRSHCCGTMWTSWWALQMSISGQVTPRTPSSNLNKPKCWIHTSSKVSCWIRACVHVDFFLGREA